MLNKTTGERSRQEILGRVFEIMDMGGMAKVYTSDGTEEGKIVSAGLDKVTIVVKGKGRVVLDVDKILDVVSVGGIDVR